MADYLDLDVDVLGDLVRIRVEREAAERDLGIDSVEPAAFAHWAAENQGRIARAALAKDRLPAPATEIEDRRVTIRAGDLARFDPLHSAST